MLRQKLIVHGETIEIENSPIKKKEFEKELPVNSEYIF